MKLLYILAFFIVMSQTQCGSKKEMSFFDKTDKSGIRETGFINTSSELVEEHRYYFPNGKVKVKEFYKSGKLNGYRTTYYSTGVIEQVSYFINGLLNGWTFNYDAIGKLLSKVYFFEGNQIGDAFFYFPNGKEEQYILLNYQSNKEATIFYSMDGFIIDSIGKRVFIDTLYENKPDIISDTIYIGIILSHPPKTRIQLSIIEYDSTGNIINKNYLDSTLPYIYFKKAINRRLLSMKISADQYDSSNNHTTTEVREISF